MINTKTKQYRTILTIFYLILQTSSHSSDDVAYTGRGIQTKNIYNRSWISGHLWDNCPLNQTVFVSLCISPGSVTDTDTEYRGISKYRIPIPTDPALLCMCDPLSVLDLEHNVHTTGHNHSTVYDLQGHSDRESEITNNKPISTVDLSCNPYRHWSIEHTHTHTDRHEARPDRSGWRTSIHMNTASDCREMSPCV